MCSGCGSTGQRQLLTRSSCSTAPSLRCLSLMMTSLLRVPIIIIIIIIINIIFIIINIIPTALCGYPPKGRPPLKINVFFRALPKLPLMGNMGFISADHQCQNETEGNQALWYSTTWITFGLAFIFILICNCRQFNQQQKMLYQS